MYKYFPSEMSKNIHTTLSLSRTLPDLSLSLISTFLSLSLSLSFSLSFSLSLFLSPHSHTHKRRHTHTHTHTTQCLVFSRIVHKQTVMKTSPSHEANVILFKSWSHG